jgi:hypothetical protein
MPLLLRRDEALNPLIFVSKNLEREGFQNCLAVGFLTLTGFLFLNSGLYR